MRKQSENKDKNEMKDRNGKDMKWMMKNGKKIKGKIKNNKRMKG
jgi:hypothetical protein